MPRYTRTSLMLLALLCIGGCASEGEGATREIIDEVISGNFGALAWAAAWRSFTFGLLGLVLGLGAFFGLRKRELLRLSWQHAKWVRGVAGVLLVIAFAGAGSWWGFWRGVVQGTEQTMRDGKLGTEILPMVGDAGSMMIAAIYVGSELVDQVDQADQAGQQAGLDDAQLTALEVRVATYAKGEWAMGTDELLARLARVRAQGIEIGSELAKREVYARYPELEGTLADELIPWTLDKFSAELSAKLLEKATDSETAAMFAKPLQELFTTLDEAAAREGDPSTLTHVELRAHIVEVALVPMLTHPIERFAHGQQKTALLVLLLFVLVTIGGFRLADYLILRRAKASPAEPTPPTSGA